MGINNKASDVWVIVHRDSKTMIMEWYSDNLHEGMEILSIEQLQKFRIIGNDWYPIGHTLYPAKLVELISTYNKRMSRRHKNRIRSSK